MLIANMVGRDEANRYLDEVLDHLKPMVGAIVFTDDGSEDKTPEIASSYGAHVYKMNEPTFEKNEGLLRTTAWANLSKHAKIGDWILAIDCDEMLYASNPMVSMSSLMANQYFDVVNIKFYHMWNETQYRVDGAWAPTNSSRMFRYFYGGRFNDRALACGSEPQYVQTLMGRGKYMEDSGLIMKHLGYIRDDDKAAKYERYMRLDGGNFHARAHLESIINPNPTLCDWNI